MPADQPLRGRSILVTRARHQAGRLSEELRGRGAEVVEIPAIEIAPPKSFAQFDAALGRLSEFEWLIVTSANAVGALRERLSALALNPDAPGHLSIAAIGSGTSKALGELGLVAAVTPAEYVAESLVTALGERTAGRRVLLIRAAGSRDVIPEALDAQGAILEIVDAYRTVIPASSVEMIRELFDGRRTVPDAATFTSSSTVTNFMALLREAGAGFPAKLKAVSIGPITSQTLRDQGIEPAGEADPHDLDGLVAAVAEALAGEA